MHSDELVDLRVMDRMSFGAPSQISMEVRDVLEWSEPSASARRLRKPTVVERTTIYICDSNDLGGRYAPHLPDHVFQLSQNVFP